MITDSRVQQRRLRVLGGALLVMGSALVGVGCERAGPVEQAGKKVAQVFRGYGLPEETVTAVVGAIRSDRKRWVDFMIKFELGMTEPEPSRARNSALTIALSYVAGGLVPLAPYFFLRSVQAALIGSVMVTLLALFVFGFVKGQFTTNRPVRSAWQTVLVGGLAAVAAFTSAQMIG